MMYKNNQELKEDETMSSSFESLIVLWSMEKIEPRLPARVAKLYGHQMTGNKTLFDLQSTIFQDIPAILLDLENEDRSTLGATKEEGEDRTQINYLRTLYVTLSVTLSLCYYVCHNFTLLRCLILYLLLC